jgi:hypothetical protein
VEEEGREAGEHKGEKKNKKKRRRRTGPIPLVSSFRLKVPSSGVELAAPGRQVMTAVLTLDAWL